MSKSFLKSYYNIKIEKNLDKKFFTKVFQKTSTKDIKGDFVEKLKEQFGRKM
jgi:hypothetical protein